MGEAKKAKTSRIHIGFRASIITVFVIGVLLVGLTLVYLSFSRVTLITRTAASTFIDKVSQLGADRIDTQFRNVRDSLEILAGLPSIQEAEIDDNYRLYGLMASMLRNNPQLFSLYVGYEDGSFLEMDVIDRAKPAFRRNLNVDEDAVYRVVVIARGASTKPTTLFLSDNLVQVGEAPGPTGYDPRRRSWYIDAFKDQTTLLTGPYTFYATGQPGYTLRLSLKEGRRGVVAGDLLLNRLEDMLDKQRFGASGLAFLFNGSDQIVAHPEMDRLMSEIPERADDLPHINAVNLPGLASAIQIWKSGGPSQQFFVDRGGRSYVVASHRIQAAGTANVRLAIIAPLDEFFSQIVAERRNLIVLALGFVVAMLPLAFWLGSLLARSLRELAVQTEEIQRFQLLDRPPLRSIIKEIDNLGRSVSTMRSVVRSFASFIPQPIVRQLIESGTSLKLGGTRREITVMFSDVADFTKKTENADPSEVMIFTSRYFAALSEVIMAHEGTVDKFIGDAVMAMWNAPVDDPDHVVHGCRGVLHCVRRNDDLDREFLSEGWPTYTTRFGLHVGEAVVGNVGSSDRMSYTALGATVNLASRLEALNKVYGTRILTSQAVKDHADTQFVFRRVDEIKPKGFGQTVTIYELCGERGMKDVNSDFIKQWDSVYRSMQQGDPTIARESVSGFLAAYPSDGVARYHADRLLEKADPQ